MQAFDEVKLKEGVTHSCPEGRTDNETSIVLVVFGDGEVKLSRDLHGCMWWNVNDLELVTSRLTNG